MATALITVHCKLFQMMPYIIKLNVRKFHQPTATRFSTSGKTLWGGGTTPRSLNRVKNISLDTVIPWMQLAPSNITGNGCYFVSYRRSNFNFFIQCCSIAVNFL